MRGVQSMIGCLALAAGLGLESAPALALTPEERGLEVARAADLRESGFGDYAADVELVLRNRQGHESVRRLRVRVLEQLDDGDKGWVYFDEPADVAGTALLTFSHKQGNDDQWLYLPAVQRVKRISSTNKTGPFMGSEFSYEDLSSQEVEEYAYRYLGEEAVDGVECFVIERHPVDPRSGYSRQVAWHDREAYRLMRVDFYDRRDELLKTLTQHDFQLYAGRFWKPAKLVMVNHQTGKTTEAIWRRYVFGNGLADDDFDPLRLSSSW